MYTHAVRTSNEIDSILKGGLRPNPNAGNQVFLSRVPLVRNRGAGYIVVAIKKDAKDVEHSTDYVEKGLTYPQSTVRRVLEPSEIVKVVRQVPIGTGGHGIREDNLARFALDKQGIANNEISDLPEKYQKWFYFSQASRDSVDKP